MQSKEERNAYFLKWKTKRRNRRYHWLRKYMVAKGCTHCGYNQHYAALQWDHIEPIKDKKERRMGHYISCRSLKVLRAEIDKCQILCANCHAIKTKQEGGYNGTRSD